MKTTLSTNDSVVTRFIRRRSLTLALWIAQVLVALQFIIGGLLKLTGSPEMVDMFTSIGAGQWLRYLVGLLEVAGAVGLLIPRLSGLAALGLVGLLIGATATNIAILGADPWFPLILLLLCVLIVVGRRSHINALLNRFTR